MENIVEVLAKVKDLSAVVPDEFKGKFDEIIGMLTKMVPGGGDI